MKNFRKFCVAMTLALALALSASAGDMAGPGVTNPPPQQQSSVMGEMGAPGASAMGEISAPGAIALNPVTGVALSLLRSILSLF